MKAATVALRNTLEQNNSIGVNARLIAEWEHNRYQIPTMTVTPTQDTSDEDWTAAFGDLDSVGTPNRPITGIAKARLDSIVTPLDVVRDKPNESRFYPAGYKDNYGYFGSTQHSSLVVNGSGGYDFDAPIVITSTYATPIVVNKMVIGFETSYAKPKSFSVEVSTDGSGWYTISTDPVIDVTGQVVLYYNGAQFWGDTEQYDEAMTIVAVRVNVYSMDTAYSHLDLIQLSPRLENDLSDFLVKYDVQMQVDSPSFIAPMGKASSNTASVTLSNIDGRFNNNNTSSVYYGMIDKKVRFKLDLGIDATPQGGEKYEYIREFTMWTDAWGNQDQSTVDVSLKDSSVVLQERTMPSVFFQNCSVGAIIWQVMDLVGLSNYEYTRAEDEGGQIIPYYWPSDTSETSNPRWGRRKVNTTPPPMTTIWDEFAAIAESTQTAVYFDEYDVLQIKSRSIMYTNATVAWNLDAVQNGTKLPDVVSTSTDYNMTTNEVDITFRPCAYSSDQNGFPKMEQLWAPSAPTSTDIVPSDVQATSDVILRGSPLIRDLTAGTDIWINPAEAVFWEYESDVNIEGECLHYKGKEYGYYAADNSFQKQVIYSVDEQTSLDSLSDSLHWKNAYTGRLVVTARALYGSYQQDHIIEPDTYSSIITSWDNQLFYPYSSGVQYESGFVRQTNTPGAGTQYERTYHLRKHNTAVMPITPTSTVWYGVSMRLPNLGTPSWNDTNWNIGGIFFAGDWGDAGYYLEVTSTVHIDELENRQWRNEICLFGMPGNAPVQQLTGANGDPKGYSVEINQDQWYNIDISYQKTSAGRAVITAYVNGVLAGNWDVPPTTSPEGHYTNQGRFGTVVRGPSTADYEYLYALAQDDTNPLQNPDATSFLDLESGSFISGFVPQNIRWNYHTINPSYRYPSGGYVTVPQNINNGDMVFEEYGPLVHEMRTFDVAFDTSKVPAASSYVYLTNPQARVLYYESDAFGAEFMIANASRGNVVINGQDDITSGPNNPINQTLFVYGAALYQAQNDNYVIKRDEVAIRKQGVIRTQFTSRYLQTQDMANEMGQWVLDLWSLGVDEVAAVVFGNPLLQLGDLVTMNYPIRGMLPTTHKYFVTGIRNTYESGYKTELTLRRCKL